MFNNKSKVNGQWSMVCDPDFVVHGPQSTVLSLEFLLIKPTSHRLWTIDDRLFSPLPSTVVRGLWTALLLVFALSATAQYAGYKPVSDIAVFKKQFIVEAKKIQSIKSAFVQEKNLSVLEEKISSEGKFYFKRENKVRIEYEKPFQYLMIMNGDQMLVRDNQKENKVNVKSNKLFQQVNKIMVDCVQGTMLDNKDFTVNVFQRDETWLLEMTPSGKGLKEFFQRILIYVDKKDYSVSSIDMQEPSGDNTMIRFTQKELNVTIQDAMFTIK